MDTLVFPVGCVRFCVQREPRLWHKNWRGWLANCLRPRASWPLLLRRYITYALTLN